MPDHATVMATSIRRQLALTVVLLLANLDDCGSTLRPHRLAFERVGQANQVAGDIFARNAVRKPSRFGRLLSIAQGAI